MEATEELMNTFRPVRESVEELKRLLLAKADPNAPVPPGRGAPLSHVITLAPADKVGPMRDLLLSYGALESKDNQDHWKINQEAAANEHHRIEAFFEDDRHLSPVGAAMDHA